MFNWIVRVSKQYLEPFSFVDLSEIELFETEVFVHSTTYKHMSDIWLNCSWYIAILKTI